MSEEFGAFLRREREARGMTLREVSERTRIKERWLSLIEESRVDQLPADVFVRGFVRAYARAVGADEAVAGRLLTARLAERSGTGPGDGDADLDAFTSKIIRHRRLGLILALPLLLVAALLSIFAMLRHRP